MCGGQSAKHHVANLLRFIFFTKIDIIEIGQTLIKIIVKTKRGHFLSGHSVVR